jgi:hypothetical protein
MPDISRHRSAAPAQPEMPRTVRSTATTIVALIIVSSEAERCTGGLRIGFGVAGAPLPGRYSPAELWR